MLEIGQTPLMMIPQETGPGFPQTLHSLVNANFLNMQSLTLEEGSVFAGASGQESGCLENCEWSKRNNSCPDKHRLELPRCKRKGKTMSVYSRNIRLPYILNT